MWTIAHGILLYGWFFYPLYAVGDRELHRVADAAVLHRYRQAEGPRSRNSHWPTFSVESSGSSSGASSGAKPLADRRRFANCEMRVPMPTSPTSQRPWMQCRPWRSSGTRSMRYS